MWVIEDKEVRRDDPIKYLLSIGDQMYLLSSAEVMAIKITKNEKITGRGKNGRGEGVGYAIRRKKSE